MITALILDANVCLDLAALGRERMDTGGQEEARRFVQEIADSGVDVLPGFGLAELCLRRKGWVLDQVRLESLERSISFAINSAPGRKEQHQLTGDTDEVEPVDLQMFRPFTPLLQIFYASLLKISTLTNTGLSRTSAVRNVREYLRWAADEFGCVAVLPLQAAVAIFGGDSLARKLIGADGHCLTPRTVWGGAWDVFYVHQLYHATLTEIEGLAYYPVFVTRDRACYDVFSQSRLQGAIRFDAGRRPQLVGVSNDYPHYEGRQDEFAELFKNTALSRIQGLVDGERMTQAHLDSTISLLESEWMERHSRRTT